MVTSPMQGEFTDCILGGVGWGGVLSIFVATVTSHVLRAISIKTYWRCCIVEDFNFDVFLCPRILQQGGHWHH